MSRVVTDDKHYKNIADVIRDKTGITETLYPRDMPEKINQVYTAGQESKTDEINGLKRDVSRLETEITELELEVEQSYMDGQQSILDRKDISRSSITALRTVMADNVFEFEHNVFVRVSNKNIWEFDNTYTIEGTGQNNTYVSTDLSRNGEADFVFSCDIGLSDVEYSATGNLVYLYVVYANGTSKTFSIATTSTDVNRIEVLIPRDSAIARFEIATHARFTSGIVEISNIQLEVGALATAYVPHISDFSTLEVTQVGKNLVSALTKGVVDINNFPNLTDANSEIYRTVCLKNLKAGSYTFSFEKNVKIVRSLSTSKHDNNVAITPTAVSNTQKSTITLSQNEEEYYLSFRDYKSGSDWDNAWVQCEVGSLATEYQPYTEQRFKANADGTIEDAKSISPEMIFTADEEVNVYVSYWKVSEG